MLLLKRELNPPLVDVIVDVESERSNRSADASLEVAKQGTSHQSRILKRMCAGAQEGAVAAALGRGGYGDMLTNRLRKIGSDFAVLFSAVPRCGMSVKEVQESFSFYKG
jgi:hypothetical protein